MQVLDGKKTSLKIQDEIAIEVKKIIAEGKKKASSSSYSGWK